MAMDVTRAPIIPQNEPPAGPRSGVTTEPTIADEHSRDQRNAVNQFQARYGEKPKEARQIKKSLDKDDFMRIMISEMKHQDPTKPMDADKMATQMAQLTTVEQIKNMGTAIEKLADNNKASDRMAMSGMIGKNVTVDKSRFTHLKGTLSPMNFDLPADADKIKVSVLDERGEEVATHELEPMKAGPNVYNWDGLNGSNLPANSGTYMVRVEAEDKKGAPISINPISKETIIGVAFEGGEANFLVGDPKSPQRVAMRSVTRIESDGEARAAVGQAKAGQAKAAQDGQKNGAANQPFDLPAGLKEKFQADLAAKGGSNDTASNDSKPEGFANGLSGE
jgi:flagellar basal-body rod modification protein FlgD